MDYCKRCVFPVNAKPDIILDEAGVCSGCRYIEQKMTVTNWPDRMEWFREILEKYKAEAREAGRLWDCIIPVSGGKDSHWQVHVAKEVCGMTPLLVCYNHVFNHPIGIRNLRNLVREFGCDLVRFTSSPESVRKLARWGVRRVGDCTWHYHAGIMSYPIQVAVEKRIPLVLWGEEGFSEIVGMFNLDDMIEFTKKKRQEHCMRGFEPQDILKDPIAREEGIEAHDLAPFYYPKEERIEDVGVRGIYLGNFMLWNSKAQVREMIGRGFETAQDKQMTFDVHGKVDDLHAAGVHSYLKFLKFGYGRATDDTSNEVRMGRIGRGEAIDLVMKYDGLRPHDLDLFLKFVGWTERQFEDYIEPMRDKSAWAKRPNGLWELKDNVGNHRNDPGVQEARIRYAGDGQPFAFERSAGKKEREYANEHLDFNRLKEYVVL